MWVQTPGYVLCRLFVGRRRYLAGNRNADCSEILKYGISCGEFSECDICMNNGENYLHCACKYTRMNDANGRGGI